MKYTICKREEGLIVEPGQRISLIPKKIDGVQIMECQVCNEFLNKLTADLARGKHMTVIRNLIGFIVEKEA